MAAVEDQDDVLLAPEVGEVHRPVVEGFEGEERRLRSHGHAPDICGEQVMAVHGTQGLGGGGRGCEEAGKQQRQDAGADRRSRRVFHGNRFVSGRRVMSRQYTGEAA